MLTHPDLRGYDVLILGAPTKELDPNEILAIIDFVDQGGGLLLIGQAHNPGLTQYYELRNRKLVGWVASKFLVNFHSLNQLTSKFGIIFTNENITAGKKFMKSTGLPLPIITQFSTHPILQGVNELVISGGAPIQIKGEFKGIAFSDEDTIPPNSVVLAVNEDKNGRVVALASPSPFTRISILRITQR